MSNQSFNGGYGIITSYALYVLNSPQHLRETLQQIPDDSYCEIFSTPTLEETNFIMLQRFSQLATRLGLLRGCEAPALPMNGEYALKLPTPLMYQGAASPSPALPPSQNATFTSAPANDGYLYSLSSPVTRFWGISFLQGFAVYSDPNTILKLLASSNYYYTRAIGYSTEQRASMMATFDYYNRFHKRYSIKDTTPTMFDTYLHNGQIWVDDHFEDHEAARSGSELWKRLRDKGLW